MRDELPIRFYQDLMTPKGRKEHSAFIIEGIRQVRQFLSSNNIKVLEILTTKNLDFDTKIPVRIINNSQLSKITDSKTPNGVIAVAEIPKVKTIDDNTTRGNILLLEDVQDPGNVGALVRSAAAFGFSAVILSRGSADIYSPKVVRSTGGALCNLDIIHKKDIYECIPELKNLGYHLIVADLDGKNDLSQRNRKVIYALGNEGNGVSDKLRLLADEIFTIPFDSSAVESLNVSAAGAIGMFFFRNI